MTSCDPKCQKELTSPTNYSNLSDGGDAEACVSHLGGHGSSQNGGHGSGNKVGHDSGYGGGHES